MELRFKNGEFKIMQIADVQEHPEYSKDTLLLMELALEREKPDLVVFSGDQIQGYSGTFKKGNALVSLKELIDTILSPVVKRDIPFAVTFGNHDRQCGVPNAVQMEIYKKYPQCVWSEPCGPADRGTYSFSLLSEKSGKPVFHIYMIDSNGLSPKNGYDPVSKEQIEWFRREREKHYADCGEYLPSFVFQHIPVPEVFDGLVQCKRTHKNAIPAFRSHAGKHYRLTEEQYARGDFLLEAPAPPDVNNGEFDALCEKGDIIGLFFGHDHANSFVTQVRGITLAYAQGTGFTVYGPGTNRGVRVFTLNEANLREFETHTATYAALTDKKPDSTLNELVYRNMPYGIVKRVYSRLMNHSTLFPM